MKITVTSNCLCVVFNVLMFLVGNSGGFLDYARISYLFCNSYIWKPKLAFT